MAFEDYFFRTECTVLPQISHSWESDNSHVSSCPAITLDGIENIGLATVGASLVTISGSSSEKLHYHSSHLIGVVVRGEGWLRMPMHGSQDQEQKIIVTSGDGIVIPRGQYHLFETESGITMEYVALELSDQPIDYQKHFI